MAETTSAKLPVRKSSRSERHHHHPKGLVSFVQFCNRIKKVFFLFTTLTVEKPERGLKNNMKRGWMKSFRTLIYIYFKCFFFSVLFIFYIFFKRPLLFIFIIRPVKMTRPVCFGPMSCLTL